jgi:hypothetical protein
MSQIQQDSKTGAMAALQIEWLGDMSDRISKAFKLE